MTWESCENLPKRTSCEFAYTYDGKHFVPCFWWNDLLKSENSLEPAPDLARCVASKPPLPAIEWELCSFRSERAKEKHEVNVRAGLEEKCVSSLCTYATTGKWRGFTKAAQAEGKMKPWKKTHDSMMSWGWQKAMEKECMFEMGGIRLSKEEVLQKILTPKDTFNKKVCNCASEDSCP
ncbi:unnamed protein product [Durusdinium trenchii]